MSREGLIPQFQTRGIQVKELKYGGQSVSVYQGTCQNFAVAVKVLSLTPMADSSQLEKECKTLMSLSHPNILRLYDCFWENSGVAYFFVIVTEWCEKDLAKDMKQRAENYFPWGEDDLWKLLIEIVGALTYMQEQGISHRDIKPENIFLTSTKTTKLGDFGSARAFLSDKDYATLTGTPFYLSPKLREAFLNRNPKVVHNSFKSDVYSLGLTLLSLALLGPPLSLANVNLTNEEVGAVISSVPYSDLFKSMLAQMLSVEEDTRCDFKTLTAWIDTNDPRHEKPLIPPPKKMNEMLCLQCRQVIDKFSETAQCEVVQLYCEPSKHMFCSRECCRSFLSLGIYKCPECSVVIPIDTIAFYLPEALRKKRVESPTIPAATGNSKIEEEKHSPMPIQVAERPNEKPKEELVCMHCGKMVNRYSSTAECEVVQLYCEPSKHMFCSRECCRAYLSLECYKCPKCEVEIPMETVAFYRSEQKHEPFQDSSYSGEMKNEDFDTEGRRESPPEPALNDLPEPKEVFEEGKNRSNAPSEYKHRGEIDTGDDSHRYRECGCGKCFCW